MGKKNISKYFDLLIKEEDSFLKFLKARFPLFHNSKFFYRDLEYGIISFLEKKDLIINYAKAEELTKMISKHFVEKGIFIQINNNGWKVNYPEFAAKVPGDPF